MIRIKCPVCRKKIYDLYDDSKGNISILCHKCGHKMLTLTSESVSSVKTIDDVKKTIKEVEKKMNKDKTGPNGKGPRTGRGKGDCPKPEEEKKEEKK